MGESRPGRRPRFEDVKELIAGQVLSRSRLRRQPLPSWPWLLVRAIGVTVVRALWLQLWLALLVGIVRHYWWPNMGALSLIAFGVGVIMQLFPQDRPDRPRRLSAVCRR